MKEELTETQVRQALSKVSDPELGFSIVDLGLVREIAISDQAVQVSMTLTTPACPYAPQILADTEAAIAEIAAGREPVIHLVWEPPWNPREEASDDVLNSLGIWI
jgi:metal-sulfur cluster biosynthetic enzyme